MYASNPTGHFPDVASLMADFAVYAREHRDDSLSPLQYSSALVANSLPVLAAVALTLPGSPKCIACSAPITTVDARTQLPHKHCVPCFRDFMSTRKSVNGYDKPGPIVKKPTSAQLLAARAMVASFDALPPTKTPASPGLQQQAVLPRVPTDVIADDYAFYMSSLASPSISLLSSSPLCINAYMAPTCTLRFYDNACSYSMVKDINSLDNVEKLPTPFLIGGIGGSSVYATHHGLLQGFPLNLAKAYWGPLFDVDLTSLGYIQRCGGSYVGVGDYLYVYNVESKTMIASGDPKVLLANSKDPRVIQFLTRGAECKPALPCLPAGRQQAES